MHFTYCPYCGSKAIGKEIGDEGVIPYCEKCETPLWDMFTTSIIAAVVNEYDEIALLRQDYVSTTKHVCVAGIMKIGESAEDTVIREVKEEIGQDVEQLEFIHSYPYDKREMLMLGYKATVKKKEFQLSGEVNSVQWVKLEDAPALLREGSIAWHLVNSVINNMRTSKAVADNSNLYTVEPSAVPEYPIVKVTERPEIKGIMSEWFHSKWGIPKEAYLDSMNDAISGKMIYPQWYVMLDGTKIIAGAGIIDNDFHERTDLSPNLCAVFTEPEYRNKGLAGKLLDYICKDMAKARVKELYLITGHTSFYERYGWEFIGMVREDSGDMTRMYKHVEE